MGVLKVRNKQGLTSVVAGPKYLPKNWFRTSTKDTVNCETSGLNWQVDIPGVSSIRAPSSDEDKATAGPSVSSTAASSPQQQSVAAVEQLRQPQNPSAEGNCHRIEGLDISPLRVSSIGHRHLHSLPPPPPTQHQQEAPLKLVHARHRHSSSGTASNLFYYLLLKNRYVMGSKCRHDR